MRWAAMRQAACCARAADTGSRLLTAWVLSGVLLQQSQEARHTDCNKAKKHVILTQAREELELYSVRGAEMVLTNLASTGRGHLAERCITLTL